MLAKAFMLMTMAAVIGGTDAMRAFAQGTNAPLPLFINGGGQVSPFTNGEPLEVGQTYHMVATPNAGFQFGSWQPVNVFTVTSYIIDPYGNTNANVSVTVSRIPTFTNQASLDFVMQPVVVIYDVPGVRTLTESTGWQANFVPVVLNIQWGDSAVILSWTNSSFTLQAAPTASGAYTNVPGASSPYTNSISGTAQYFRLVSD